MSAFTGGTPRRSRAPGGRRVAQQRLADPLAEDPALAREAPSTVQLCSLPFLSRGARPARPGRGRARSTSRTTCGSRRPRARHALPSSGSSVSDTSSRWPGRRARAVGRHQRPGAPAEPRGEPAEEEHARHARVGPVADRHRVDPQEPAPARRVEGEATRSRHGVVRSQARSTTYAPAPAPSRGAAPRRVGLVHRVDQHDLRHVEQRVDRLGVAVRRPDQRRQVGHDERVHDRVELREVLPPGRGPRARA